MRNGDNQEAWLIKHAETIRRQDRLQAVKVAGILAAIIGALIYLVAINVYGDVYEVPASSTTRWIETDAPIRWVQNPIKQIPGDTPADPIDPQPPGDLTAFARQIRSRAIEVNRPMEATALGGVYQGMAQKVADGTIRPNQAGDVLRRTIDIVLQAQGSKAEWEGFRDWLKEASPTIRTKDELAAYYTEVSSGLLAAGPNAAIDIEAIIQLISLIASGNPTLPELLPLILRIVLSIIGG